MAFNFLESIFGSNAYLGIDIGTTSIKVIELVKTKGLPFLRNYGFLESYGHLERPNNAIQTSSLKMLENETVDLLKLMVKHTKSNSKNAIASLPSFSAFTTLLEMPLMPDGDTSKIMGFQAKQYIPLPISSVTIDWIRVGEKKNENGDRVQQILLISVPNEIISRYKNIFKAAGLNLVALEIEGLSVARILTSGIKEDTLIVDIGSRSTSIYVAQDGNLKFSGQTDFSGGSLTQTISSGLNIRIRRAEDLKKLRGLTGTGGEYELSTLMMPILDVIINEAERVKNNFENSYNEKVSNVILTGGGSNLLGIEKYFEDQIGLPVKKAEPFSKISYPGEMEPIIRDLGPYLSVALGLGVKNI
jgi:type IV pilus assembly protein PilM